MGQGPSLPEKNSYEVEGPPVAGEGPARRAFPKLPELNGALPTCGRGGPEVDNLYSNFALTAKNNPGSQCMGKRAKLSGGAPGPFEFISFTTAHEQVLTIGSGIASLGLPASAKYGMYGKNVMEWQLCALAGWSRGLVCVPVYDTLGDNIVVYEANHADVSIMFVEGSKMKSVVPVLKDCPTIKYLVQMDGEIDAALASSAPSTVSLLTLKELSEKGLAQPVPPSPSKGEDLAFIMYTSGTTSDPKGVMITNMSIVVGASWCAGLTLYNTDRYLSFLPLAHIFETMVEHAVWSAGGSVGFFNGNIKALQDDILALKPTLFVGVPRVYQRFYDVAMSKIDAMPAPLKSFLSYALAQETEAARVGSSSLYGPLLHKLLGAKLTGGKVRLMISGAAPLPLHVQEFLLAACGCSVIQGYGMTENCANATLAHMADYRAGHVGGPMPTMELKLIDVPEMEYTTDKSPPTGEVVCRGPCVFAGYHKNQAETDKVLTKDGWLHTGDIGRWNPDGTLSIIDRKKNIFKLAQGEYIAAEKIEMALSKSKYISQPWVYGNSFLPMLVAVITPDFPALVATAQAEGWYVDDKVALVKKPEAIKLIMKEIEAESKASALKSFEVPKKCILEGEINELAQGFSIENDCLTPTFKLKRPQLLKRYKAQVDEMYVALGEDPTKQQ